MELTCVVEGVESATQRAALPEAYNSRLAHR
jgi:hypothetical protein